MLKRLFYWLEKRSHYKTLIYWGAEVTAAKERLVFCEKALKHYQANKVE